MIIPIILCLLLLLVCGAQLELWEFKMLYWAIFVGTSCALLYFAYIMLSEIAYYILKKRYLKDDDDE